MYTNNEILFPRHAVPALRDVRGIHWQALVERVIDLPEMHEESLAFVLMMIRLNGCLNCETDSYRAMRGCTACAHQALRRFKGEDAELISMFDRALEDVRAHASRQRQSGIITASALHAEPASGG